MNCICGHDEKDHVVGGRCRVPDCPCELFQPGMAFSTLPGGVDDGPGSPRGEVVIPPARPGAPTGAGAAGTGGTRATTLV